MKDLLKNGIIGGLALIIANLIFVVWHNTNLTINSLVSIGVITFLIFHVNNAIDKTKLENDGFISFNKAFKTAFYIFLISIFLSNVFTLVQDQLFFPNKYDEAKNQALEQLYQQFGDEYIDQYESIFTKMFKPGFVFFIQMIGSGLFYLIIALIIASFKKNEDANEILK